MPILLNINYRTFKRIYGDRKVLAYGASGTFRDFEPNDHGHLDEVFSKVDFVCDGDPSKKGNKVSLGKRVYEVKSLEDLKNIGGQLSRTHVLIMTIQLEYVLDALQKLDKVNGLKEIPCFSLFWILKWGWQPGDLDMFPDYGGSSVKIPKKIHYCWFGENQISEHNRKYIESWQHHCTDYEIKFWNEYNYPLKDTPEFVKQAYAHKKYSFVSDYVRLDILYQEGGIYLDTDMELFGNFDKLLRFKAFYAFENRNLIATGLGFGCMKGDRNVGLLRDMYKYAHFINDNGKMNLVACPFYQTAFFQMLGVEINDTTQVLDDMAFLSSEYLCSFDQDNGTYILSDYTLGLHHYDCSWFEDSERQTWQEKKAINADFNYRLLDDYLRLQGGGLEP